MNFAGGIIENSYVTGTVTGPAAGGAIGYNWNAGAAEAHDSYSVGTVTGSGSGGFIGTDTAPTRSIDECYWDLDTSGIDNPHQGAGSPLDDPGITGLTDAELKSGLPAGFDPAIWSENPNINNGYPYLIANPPPQ